MVSSRFAVPTLVMLVLAIVPTVIHSYRGALVHDGLSVAAIPTVLDGFPSTPTSRRADWVKERLDSDDWTERRYQVASEEVRLFVGRSYDAKRLYHHPELALVRNMNTRPVGTVLVDSRPDVRLHVLRTSRDERRGVAVYALLHDGRFVGNPILFQLLTSAELLVSGRKPMTLFLASDLAGSPEALNEAPAARVLLAAIAAFEAQGSNSAR